MSVPAKKTPRLIPLLAGLYLVSACATYSDKTADARLAVHAGDLQGGVDELNSFMKVRSAESLPSKWEKDTPLAVLERGTVLQALGEFELSARDMESADKELELLDLSGDAVGKIGKFIYSDSAGKYKASPIEKLALNSMNMLNYLARGDLNGARVEAKRFTVMRNYLRDQDPERSYLAFGSYLAGFTMERLGESDSALRYYDEALESGDLRGLDAPIARLAAKGSYRSEAIEAAIARGSSDGDGSADILLVAKVGRSPYRIPRRIPIGLAVGLAHNHVTGDPSVLEHSAFKVVTFPDIRKTENRYEHASVELRGKKIRTELTSDIGMEVIRDYEELAPMIIGASITRMIARAIAAEGARAGGNAAGSSKGNSSAGSVIGLLAALAVEGTMVALDKPDTRSWTMLPDRVFIARARVEPGEHQLEVRLSGPGGRETRLVDISVPENGFVVVDMTTLR